ncbi:MAG TPA: hypothetical protein P5556_02290 [Candidatus Gastranaerophilales bacterium]|nr:hypothetical protein [Candidatus Gastranaerophilales bacterium]
MENLNENIISNSNEPVLYEEDYEKEMEEIDEEFRLLRTDNDKAELCQCPNVNHLSFDANIVKTFILCLNNIKRAPLYFEDNKTLYIKAVDGIVRFIYPDKKFKLEFRLPTKNCLNNEIIRENLIINIQFFLYLLRTSCCPELTFKEHKGFSITLDIGGIDDLPIDNYYIEHELYNEIYTDISDCRRDFKENFIKIDRVKFSEFCSKTWKALSVLKQAKLKTGLIIEDKKAYVEIMENIIFAEISNAEVKEKISLSMESLLLLKNLLEALNKIEKYYKKMDKRKEEFSISYFIPDKDKIIFDAKFFTIILPLEYVDNVDLEPIKMKIRDVTLNESSDVSPEIMFKRLNLTNIHPFLKQAEIINEDKQLCLKMATTSKKEVHTQIRENSKFNVNRTFCRKQYIIFLKFIKIFKNEYGWNYINNNEDIIFLTDEKNSKTEDIAAKIVWCNNY